MKWPKDEGKQNALNKDHSTSTEELARMYGVGAGVQIQSVHHRTGATVLSSATSSSASVATNAGSTAALLASSSQSKKGHKGKKHNNLHSFHHKQQHGYRPTERPSKEFSLLLNRAPVPKGIFEKKKKDPRGQHYFLNVADDDEDDIPGGEYESINAARVCAKYELTKEKPNFLPVVLASLTISLGSCAVGFSTAYTAPALPSMQAPGNDFAVTATEGSWIASLMPLSALLGGMLGGPMIEYIGRRTTILCTAIPFTIAFLLIAFAPNPYFVMCGRSLTGLCVGICSLSLPVYMGETVQPEVRGTLGLLPTAFGNLGILLVYVAGKYLDWKNLALLGSLLPVPFLICMFLIPETPQWYMNKSDQKNARKALQWLRGPDADVSQEFDEMESTNEIVKGQGEPSFTTLFSRIYARPVLISLGLMFFQQMSGINAYIFYAVAIFTASGSKIDSNLSSIIVGLVNFFSIFLATVFIDKLGRKILLFVSSATMVAMLAIMGGFFYLKDHNYDVSAYGWIPLLSFVTLVLGFSAGVGPIPWLMMGEILPARIRGNAAALATAFNWTCTFFVVKTFTNLSEWIGFHGAFWLFGVICAANMVFVVLFVPETQGKSLEDIERNLTGGAKGPVRQVRRMSSIAHLKPLPMAV